MDVLSEIGAWIASNESLLSGIAALIVVGGVIFTPIGAGVRRVLLRKVEPGTQPASAPVEGVREPEPEREITFSDLTRPSPHEIRLARSGDLRIAYNDRGSGPPDILLTPGIVSHLHVLDQLPSTRETLARLARFARVVTFDKRGQGLSDPTPAPPTLDERCADIEAVMDAAGLERAVLFGISEGGPMCLQFAVTRPERVQGLVLLGTAARWVQSEEFPQGIPLRALQSLASSWGTGSLREVFFPGVSRSVLSDDTYRAFERLIADRQSIRQLAEQIAAYDMRDLLPQVAVPTLVVHFTGDLAVPVRLGRMLAEGIPGAEFLEVHGIDHADLARSDTATARVEEFCREVAGAA